MKEFFEGVFKRTSVFIVVAGAILILIGATSGITVGAFAIKIPDLAWRVFVAAVGTILTGVGLFFEWREYLEIKREDDSKKVISKEGTEKKLPAPEFEQVSVSLQTIDFNYGSSPLNHGWKLTQEENAVEPTITHVSDVGFWGKAIKIRATATYALDCFVKPLAQAGQRLEFAAKLEGGYGIYAHVNIQSQDWAARKDVWLNFQVGNSQPLPYGDGSTEWTVYLKPKPLGDEWALFRVNLVDEVERSFGMKVGSYGNLEDSVFAEICNWHTSRYSE